MIREAWIWIFSLKMLRFSIEKWHFDGDPRRGFELYHDLFHGLEVWKNIAWNVELCWVMVFLAFENWKFGFWIWPSRELNPRIYQKTKKETPALPTELSRLDTQHNKEIKI